MMHDEHKKPANEVQWRGCLFQVPISGAYKVLKEETNK